MNRISCLVLDVDGVLTDSRIYFTDEGIHLLPRRMTPEVAETKPETEEYSIWLADEE